MYLQRAKVCFKSKPVSVKALKTVQSRKTSSGCTLWSIRRPLGKTLSWSFQTWKRSCVWHSSVFPAAPGPPVGRCPQRPPSRSHQPPGVSPVRCPPEALERKNNNKTEKGKEAGVSRSFSQRTSALLQPPVLKPADPLLIQHKKQNLNIFMDFWQLPLNYA